MKKMKNLGLALLVSALAGCASAPVCTRPSVPVKKVPITIKVDSISQRTGVWKIDTSGLFGSTGHNECFFNITGSTDEGEGYVFAVYTDHVEDSTAEVFHQSVANSIEDGVYVTYKKDENDSRHTLLPYLEYIQIRKNPTQ